MRVPAAGATVWIDGRRGRAADAAIAIDDPAFHAGLGLFETLLLRAGRVLDLEAHLDRLSAGAIRLEVPLGPLEALRATVREAAADQDAARGWLKIVATRGGRQFVFTGALDPPPDADAGATAVLLPWRRSHRDPLVDLKTLNYAANIRGLELARSRGAEEGLWLNGRGHLAEGCTSNLFVVRPGRLHTPSLSDGILPGVVRALVIRAACERGLVIHEGKLRLKRLRHAREAFLTSSLRGVLPLLAVDGRPLGDGRPGATTRRLAAAVETLRQPDATVGGHEGRC